MTWSRSLVFLTLLSTMIPAKASTESIDFTFSAGTELFQLVEYDRNERLLDEDGLRFFAALDVEEKIAPFWRIGFFGKLYSGWVAYDGQLQSGIPYKSDTDYNGWNVEAALTRAIKTESINGIDSGWWLRLTLGHDWWRRNLRGTSGYNEDYGITYSRLGAFYNNNNWRLQAGVKYPFHTAEKVNLSKFGYDDDLRLSPPGDFSLYAQANYRFSPSWGIGLHYDGYRFSRSDTKPLRENGIIMAYAYQPETHYDSFGLSLNYHF
jgi:hypothetical protein